MTVFKELADGTRVYAGNGKYKPVAAEDRKYRKLKPDHDPLAFTWRREWHRLHVFVPDAKRGPIPETRPDEDGADHRILCECYLCKRPNVQRLKRIAMRKRREERALRPGWS